MQHYAQQKQKQKKKKEHAKETINNNFLIIKILFDQLKTLTYKKMKVTKMKILRWVYEHTKKDRIRNCWIQN